MERKHPWSEVFVNAAIAAVAMFASAFITGAAYLVYGRRRQRAYERELAELERLQLEADKRFQLPRFRPHLVREPLADEPALQLGGEEAARTL